MTIDELIATLIILAVVLIAFGAKLDDLAQKFFSEDE